MKNIASAAFLLLFFTGCGERAEQTPPESTFDMPQTNEGSAQAREVLFQVRVTGNTIEELAFDPPEFAVPSGSLIRVVLINESTSEGMEHNIVFIKQGSGESIASLGAEAGTENHYVPDHPDIIASSELVKPGSSTEFTFTAPSVGTYNYICSYPGHYPQLSGQLNVVEFDS